MAIVTFSTDLISAKDSFNTNMYSGCDNCRRHVGLMIVVCGIIRRVVEFWAMDKCDDDMPNSAKDEHTLGFLHVLSVKKSSRTKYIWLSSEGNAAERAWHLNLTGNVEYLTSLLSRYNCGGTFPICLLSAVTYVDIAHTAFVIEAKISLIILSSRSLQAAGRRSHSHYNIMPLQSFVLPLSLDFDPLQS